jgi:glycosyltransferase involved in cell wall biosynthesis
VKKLSIVVPVYYNEQSLPHLFVHLQKLEQSLINKDIATELIFVDDGSGDDSFAELLNIKHARPETKIIKLTRNFGNVRAEKAGYPYVTGDCFCCLAADLQDPPELIDEMADYWLAGEKFIICTREERVDPPLTTLFANLYYRMVRSFVIRNYPKGGYDLALMDRDMLPYMRNSGKNINPALFAFSLGYEPIVIKYKRQKREFGKSRWTFAKKFNYFIDSILGYSVIPIHIISWIGIALAIVSFGYGLFTIFEVLIKGIEVRGFASLFTLTAFLSGLILTMLGIIGQYIWRIFDEIVGLPESVVEIELID